MIEVAAIILFLCSGFFLMLVGYLNVHQHERLQKLMDQNGAGRTIRLLKPVSKTHGFLRKLKPAILRNWILFSQIVAAGIAIVGGGLFLENEIPQAVVLLSIAVALCLGSILMHKRQAQKIDQFIKQLPEAIEIIVRGARVGLTIEQNFKIVGEEMAAPVGDAFRSMAEKHQLGQELQSVLVSMSDKIGVKEFRFLAVTLVLQQRSGGQYSKLLQNLGNVLRDRQIQRKKLQTLTSEARLSAKAIALIAVGVVLLVALTNEEQIDFLINEVTGRTLLLYSATSLLLGFILISILLKFVRQ